MELRRSNRINIITTIFLLLVLFLGASWLIGIRVDETANRMHGTMIGEMGAYRSDLIAIEFKKTTELQKRVGEYLEKDGYDRHGLSELLRILLPLDGKLSRIWFFTPGDDGIVIVGRDTVRDAEKDDTVVLRRLADSLETTYYSGLYVMPEGIYWTSVNRYKGVVVGFDICLPRLHEYFAGMSPTVRSYAFIMNDKGILIAHPDEKYIGGQFPDSLELKRMREGLEHSGCYRSSCFSSYLALPVERIYYPFSVGSETWTAAVSVPRLLNEEEMKGFRGYSFLIAIITVIVFSVLLAVAQYRWRKEYDLRRKAEKEALELNLQQLKNQVNPHFLFNALNSLSVLIGSDPALAKEFVLKLSKVYRYVLEKRNESLATLADELEFTRHYYFLQKIRFGEQLSLEIDAAAGKAEGRIPAMSLQMLIENAVKHNEITRQHPLHIRIGVTGGCVTVENGYRPRPDASDDSTGVGFDHIRRIYAYYSGASFTYHIGNGNFTCVLPLI